MRIFLYVFLACASPALSQIQTNSQWGPRNARKRLLQMMRSDVEENRRRIGQMGEIRQKVEETPYFEIGYVFSEILERYRKLIEVVRRTREKRESFYHTLVHLETAQFLYMEMYHLVMMQNEIIRKYSVEFQQLRAYAESNFHSSKPMSAEMQRQKFQEVMDQERELRKDRKKAALLTSRLAILLGSKKPNPKHKLWTLDYGWEIDAAWMNETQTDNLPPPPPPPPPDYYELFGK